MEPPPFSPTGVPGGKSSGFFVLLAMTIGALHTSRRLWPVHALLAVALVLFLVQGERILCAPSGVRGEHLLAVRTPFSTYSVPERHRGSAADQIFAVRDFPRDPIPKEDRRVTSVFWGTSGPAGLTSLTTFLLYTLTTSADL